MTDPDRSPAEGVSADRPPADDGSADHAPRVLATHVPDVAAETGLTEGELRALVGELNASVADYPGVSDLVFEYRRAFSHDPLVERAGGTYFLLVPPRVWPEFGAALDVDDRSLAALRAVHERAFSAGTEFEERGDWVPLVLIG